MSGAYDTQATPVDPTFWPPASATAVVRRSAYATPRGWAGFGGIMATFVLVHGAWHGSWCWKRVRKTLQADGHEVFTPTLTGVAERSHLISPQVSLDTHIADVVNLIRWEELDDVVLCGHSYGGCVITGAADRVADRIKALVYLDAFIIGDGQALHDVLPPEVRDAQLEGAAERGHGWQVQPISAEFFRVNTS